MVALVSPSLCLSVLCFAFSRVASVGAFMCGESMWAVGLCLPSSTTGSCVCVIAKVMRNMVSSICMSSAGVLLFWMFVYVSVWCCCVVFLLIGSLLLFLCLFSFC